MDVSNSTQYMVDGALIQQRTQREEKDGRGKKFKDSITKCQFIRSLKAKKVTEKKESGQAKWQIKGSSCDEGRQKKGKEKGKREREAKTNTRIHVSVPILT